MAIKDIVQFRMNKLFPGMNVKINSGGEIGYVPYSQLLGYYMQNGLYEDLMSSSFYLNLWTPNMKPLRCPANRSVEFFVSKLMPGSLPNAVPIVSDNQRIIEPIHQVWKWSNLNSMKSVATRWLAIYGDLFIHPTFNVDGSQIYLQFLEPEKVTNWTCDSRGYIKTCRIDIPLEDGKWHTEYWDEMSQSTWIHTFGKEVPLSNLGDAVSIPLSDYGIDFVPFVQVKFRDIGDKRGFGAFSHCLDKIDEANQTATRLHEMMFRHNKPYWAVTSSATDPQGRSVPPINFKSTDKGTSLTTGKDTVEMSDETFFSLPSQAEIKSLIPDLKYADHLSVLQDQMTEIEKDLPELVYYELKDTSLSGIAITKLLGGAIDRASEARSNFEQGLQRAENMALTMGVSQGIFTNIGTYDQDGFDHSYAVREIFPLSISEKAEMIKNLTGAGVTLQDALGLVGITIGEQ